MEGNARVMEENYMRKEEEANVEAEWAAQQQVQQQVLAGVEEEVRMWRNVCQYKSVVRVIIIINRLYIYSCC